LRATHWRSTRLPPRPPPMAGVSFALRKIYIASARRATSTRTTAAAVSTSLRHDSGSEKSAGLKPGPGGGQKIRVRAIPRGSCRRGNR
jgi:hypothetical protein